jgi:hypothetical protein
MRRGAVAAFPSGPEPGFDFLFRSTNGGMEKIAITSGRAGGLEIRESLKVDYE